MRSGKGNKPEQGGESGARTSSLCCSLSGLSTRRDPSEIIIGILDWSNPWFSNGGPGAGGIGIICKRLSCFVLFFP